MEQVLQYRYCLRVLDREKGAFLRAKEVKGLSLTLDQTTLSTTTGQIWVPEKKEFANLVVTRAILEKSDHSIINTQELLKSLKVQRFNFGLHLTDAQGKYARSWNVIGAYLIKWELGGVDAASNEVIMETLEFDYERLREI